MASKRIQKVVRSPQLHVPLWTEFCDVTKKEQLVIVDCLQAYSENLV